MQIYSIHIHDFFFFFMLKEWLLGHIIHITLKNLFLLFKSKS